MSVSEAEAIDFDALEREVHATIGRLEDRGRLALDALSGDSAVKVELAAVESELEGARRELARLSLARAEFARREIAAQERPREEAQQRAYEQARSLQVDQERAARGIDSAAVSFACALRDTAKRVAPSREP